MPISEEQIYRALGTVIDPDLKLNIVDLGLIYDVKIAQANELWDIDVTMTLVSSECPYGAVLLESVKKAVQAIDPSVGTVQVAVTFTPPWTPDRTTEEARGELGYS